MKPIEIFALWERVAVCMGLERHHLLELFDEKEEDWSSIIKLSALVETALNIALRKDTPVETAAFVEKASVERKRELALKRGFLEQAQSNELRELARIRNAIVHNPAGFQFNLKKHLTDVTEQNKFLQAYESGRSPTKALANPMHTMRLATVIAVMRLIAVTNPSVLEIEGHTGV